MLTGEYDFATDPGDSQRLADEIKGSTFVAMEGLGHFPMAETPSGSSPCCCPCCSGCARPSSPSPDPDTTAEPSHRNAPRRRRIL